MKNTKKKSYVAKVPDYIYYGYWGLAISLFFFFFGKLIWGKTQSLPFLFMLPVFVGFTIVYLLLPIRALFFFSNFAIIKLSLFKIKKNIPEKTVLILGKDEIKKPSYWFSPNYDLSFLLLIRYLKVKKEDFSIYYNIDKSKLDEIMQNKEIKTVYLVGHGRRHGFAINKEEVIDYCDYDNYEKYKKDYVYQIHCNHGKGKSLVEYVVPKENWNECLPEHGYMSNFTISDMFIDKIVSFKKYGKIKSFLFGMWYNSIFMLVAMGGFFLWLLFLGVIIV